MKMTIRHVTVLVSAIIISLSLVINSSATTTSQTKQATARGNSNLSANANPYQFNFNGKLPNFNAYKPLSEKKKAFLNYMAYFARHANKEVLAKRQKIIKFYRRYLKNHILSPQHAKWLASLTKQYQVNDWDISQSKRWAELLAKIDAVPISMLLAQAANESAWGVSRFARQGNNLFGQWCYVKGCGIIPRRRTTGKTHEIRAFPSVLASVRAYMLNLNSSTHYQLFRNIRAALRSKGQPISGYILSAGLIKYSQRRQAYVASIRHIITAYQLAQRFQTPTMNLGG